MASFNFLSNLLFCGQQWENHGNFSEICMHLLGLMFIYVNFNVVQKLVMIFRKRTVNVVVLTGIVLRDGGNLIIKNSNLIETEN